jgi:hypothetical protein
MIFNGFYPVVELAQSDDDQVIKLNKTLRCNTLIEARMSLTDQLLTPPIKLGSKREAVRAKFGNPKEIIGFGNEFYKIKDATLMVSYITDNEGAMIVNLVELRPNKERPWSNLLKPTVKLPRPASGESKNKVRVTLQIRIEDIGENKSLHLTIIGNQEAVSFIHWSLIL